LLTTRTPDSCGPSECEVEPLTAERLTVVDDPHALYELSLAEGFGDGLPIVAPTEARVRALLAATPYRADDEIAVLAPRERTATVELAAVNAALAGCEPDAFPLVIAALEAIAEPAFNWPALAATTSSVFPALIVNGPSRERLGIDFAGACLGGSGGRGSGTIGRAVALCLRNIGGQRANETTKSVFGQPARITGLCFGEWEERSPWPPLATQRGVADATEVVTVHGTTGTVALADVHTDDARDLLALLARSLAVPASNMFLTPAAVTGDVVLVVNPAWARRFATEFPSVEDVQAVLHEHAWQPIDTWTGETRARLEERNRVDANGRVHLCAGPEQFAVVVAGGEGALHAVVLPSWGESKMQSVPVVR